MFTSGVEGAALEHERPVTRWVGLDGSRAGKVFWPLRYVGTTEESGGGLYLVTQRPDDKEYEAFEVRAHCAPGPGSAVGGASPEFSSGVNQSDPSTQEAANMRYAHSSATSFRPPRSASAGSTRFSLKGPAPIPAAQC